MSNDRKVIETIKSIRDHGMSKSKRYWHDQFGFNFRMTNIQAAMGCAQLEKKSTIVKERTKSVSIWREYFKNSYGKTFEFHQKRQENVGLWFYNILMPDEIRIHFYKMNS